MFTHADKDRLLSEFDKKTEKIYWSEIRKTFPQPSEYFRDPKVGPVYFNDARIGVAPNFSRQAARNEYFRYMEDRLTLEKNFDMQLALVEETRARVAKLLGTKPENIIFDNNTTDAMKLVAAMVLKEGDQFITTTGDYFKAMCVFFDPYYRLPPFEKMYLDREFHLMKSHVAEFIAAPSRFDEVGLTLQNYALKSNAIKHGSAQFIQIILGDRRYYDVKMKVVKLGESDEETLSNIEKAINDKTRLIVVSHVLRGDGTIMPVEKISEIARKHSSENRKIYVLVDGAQALGNLTQNQINVEKLGCDFYVGCAHKTLLAEQATGILYVSEQNKELIQKLLDDNIYLGGFPLLRLKAFQFHPQNQPINMFKRNDGTVEPRTVNDWARLDERTLVDFSRISTPEIASLNESLKFLLDIIGSDRVHKRIADLRIYAVEKLETLPHLKFYYREETTASPAILSFSLEGKSSEKVVEELKNKGIETTWILKPDSIRISFSIRNNEEDVDKLVEALRDIASKEPPIMK